ncbi:Uma2 family endonuclease [Desulforhabdus sp. TSK]|uniref:Uma2 family endonuclease n=1 Tax=Desulforhabdus sp. TSK TaxID=2925014 RepID=UPI001FC84046|nr:Uma2 family endonuclease [Desulforhabdus sp. TSK]GKT07873.1 hypothetical protein DSTSK_11780 [Desulforhabdus sp. TSK]
MPLLQKDEGQKYTYADTLSWPNKERWELIDGRPYDMTPAPTTRHQQIAARFYTRLEACLEGKSCVPFIAPTDVVLSQHDVVQPDLFVVCDGTKITKANIQGVPDVVVEVMSPATALKDRREKKALYERFGVREYLLIDPDGEYVERFIRQEDGLFGKGEIFSPRDGLVLHAIPEVTINLWEVFQVGKTEDA